MHAVTVISLIMVGFVVAYMLGTYARFTIGFFKSLTHYEQD